MRIDVYTWQDAYVSTIGADELLSLVHTDELNGEDSVDIATTFPLRQGYRLVWSDRLGKAHEHVCQDPKGLHAGGETIYTDTALDSVCELYGDYIEDKRPHGYGFLQALNVCLEPTRWEAGTVDQPGTVDAGLTFYHTSSRAALQSILECGGELETEISVSSGRVVSRKVCIRSHRGEKGGHRRFSYTKDLVSVSRTEHYGAITACYGYGKGVETDAGGYGRKLTFGDINNGKNYVEDAAALKLYGRPDGKGGRAHVFGQFEDSDCEDAATLLSETTAYLDAHKEPGLTYEADAVDLVQFGRGWEGVAVGDDVQIVDACFSPALRCSGRVTKLVTDELAGTVRVTLGNITETMTDVLLAQQQKVSSLSKRSTGWDVAASTPPAYLQQVVDGLNAQFNLNGNSYTFTSFEQGTIYASVPLDANGRSTTGKGSAMQLCSQGFRIASGCKADGSWDWRTFGTGDGFTADLITVGTLMGDLIKAGTIQDRTGRNYWNLDTGDFHLAPGTQLDGKDIATTDAVIKSVDVEYAQGDSRTVAPTSGWATYAPDWVDGKYIWTRTKTVMQSGDVAYSDPACISGADGQQGASGRGITAIVEQYYLSTSNTAQVNGGWSPQQPAWSNGRYIWTRSKIAWTDGTVSYTAPCLANAINGANQMAGSAIKSTVKLYAKNQSDTVPPTNAWNPEYGWSEQLPEWSDGYYIWSMERITMGDGSVRYSTPVLEDAYNKACQASHDVQSSLGDLDSTIKDATRDGIVTEAEKAAVKKAMQDVDKEREEASDQYRTLKSNSALSWQFVHNTLTPKYTAAFGSTAEGGTYGEYCDRVNDVLKCKTAGELETAMLEYNTAYSAYSTAVKEYAAAATSAQHAIEQKNAKDYADGILSSYDEQLGQQKVFNRLTNNGATQGVYMESGKLYINASYMSAGTIADAKGRNSWNLKTGVLTTNYMTANNITATGTFRCGSSNYYTMLNSTGQMAGYRPTTSGPTVDPSSQPASKVAYIDFTASTYNNVDKRTYYGIQMQAQGSIRISSPSVSTAATSSTSVTTTTGRTGTISQQIVSSVRDNGNSISWTYGNFNLGVINGLITSVGLVGT